MGRERELLERAVDEAFNREASSQVSPEQARRTMVSRGRRRRLMQATGGAGLVVAIVLAATMMFESVTPDDPQPVGDSRAIGAEEVIDYGGPMAASDEAIYVANSYYTNDAADKGSIARLDLETFQVKDTDPIAMAEAQSIALASAGLWQVGWSGGIGRGSTAHGRIQLADPDTGEVLLDIPRTDSAPYDVVVASRGQKDLAWIADAGTEQLLVVDPESGIVEAIDLDFMPTSIAAGADAVWVTGSAGRRASTLARYDLSAGTLETYPIDNCLGNLLVVGETIWGSNSCDGTIHSFDAASGEEQTTVQIGDRDREAFQGLGPMAVAKGWLWVMSGGSVQRVDPVTSELVGDPIWVHKNLGIFDPDILTVGDDVFVSSMAAGVYRLAEGLPVREPPPVVEDTPEAEEDPRGSDTCALENVMCIPLDREWSIAGAGFGSGWVGNVGEGKTFGIVRFDAETGEEVGRLPTDGFVVGFAADDRWMWALIEAGDELSALKTTHRRPWLKTSSILGTRATSESRPSWPEAALSLFRYLVGLSRASGRPTARWKRGPTRMNCRDMGPVTGL